MMMTNVGPPPMVRLLASAFTRRARRRRRCADEWRGAREPHPTRCVLEHIRRGMAEIELAKLALVADAHHDQVHLALERLIDNRGADVACLQDFGLELYRELIGDAFGSTKNSIAF